MLKDDDDHIALTKATTWLAEHSCELLLTTAAREQDVVLLHGDAMPSEEACRQLRHDLGDHCKEIVDQLVLRCTVNTHHPWVALACVDAPDNVVATVPWSQVVLFVDRLQASAPSSHTPCTIDTCDRRGYRSRDGLCARHWSERRLSACSAQHRDGSDCANKTRSTSGLCYVHQRRDAKRSALARDNLKKIQQLRTDELSAPTPARDDGHADAHPCDAHRTATTSAAQRMRNQRARGGALSGRGISMIAVLRQAKRNAAALGAKECTRCERVHVRMHAVCDIMWIPFRRLCSLHVLSAILSHPRGDVRTCIVTLNFTQAQSWSHG